MTDADIGFFDSNARLTPPLRSQRDRDAIRAGLLDGTIDAICSDHTPVDDDEKLLPFGEASPGATGLELLLSLALKWADEAAAGGDSLSLAHRQDHLRRRPRRRPARRPAGGRARRPTSALRSGRALDVERRRAGQPGQAHAFPRLRAARPGAGTPSSPARSRSSADEQVQRAKTRHDRLRAWLRVVAAPVPGLADLRAGVPVGRRRAMRERAHAALVAPAAGDLRRAAGMVRRAISDSTR